MRAGMQPRLRRLHQAHNARQGGVAPHTQRPHQQGAAAVYGAAGGVYVARKGGEVQGGAAVLAAGAGLARRALMQPGLVARPPTRPPPLASPAHHWVPHPLGHRD